MDATTNIKSGDELIRARIDSELKERFETWCAHKKVPASQILRWIIEMHLEDPNQLWTWLATQDNTMESKNDSSN